MELNSSRLPNTLAILCDVEELQADDKTQAPDAMHIH